MKRRSAPSRRKPASRPRWLLPGVALAALGGVAALVLLTRAPGGLDAVVQAAAQSTDVPRYGYRVVREYPHDPEAFTQGLIYRDGFLYESTGLNGRSSIRKVRLETGEVVQREEVDSQYFAEGLTDWQDRLVQLTWQSNLGFFYDVASFKVRGTFNYSGEGWGLTHDGRQLIMSDGSADLRFFEPASFRQTGRVTVRDRDRPIGHLNELEYVEGEIFANVWQTDSIARIDPVSGRVVGWIEMTGLLKDADHARPVDVMNGIAYDPAGKRLFVTGKLWPKLFEIALVRR